MRKTLALISSIVILALCLIPAFSMAVGNVYYVKTSNGKNLYVRDDPWKTDTNVKGSLPYGTEVTVIEYTNSNWWLVQPNNWSNPGYVMPRYLVSYYPGSYVPSPTPSKPQSSSTSSADADYSSFRQVENYTVTIKTSRTGSLAKLRWAPSKSAALMETLYSGDTVTVLAEGRNWYQVMDEENGMVGFINTSFIAK